MMKDEEFDRWKIDRLVPGDSKERERWRRDGFRINEYGKPIFAEKNLRNTRWLKFSDSRLVRRRMADSVH